MYKLYNEFYSKNSALLTVSHVDSVLIRSKNIALYPEVDGERLIKEKMIIKTESWIDKRHHS